MKKRQQKYKTSERLRLLRMVDTSTTRTNAFRTRGIKPKPITLPKLKCLEDDPLR